MRRSITWKIVAPKQSIEKQDLENTFFFFSLLSTTYETENTNSFENLSLLFRILYSLVIFKWDLFI